MLNHSDYKSSLLTTYRAPGGNARSTSVLFNSQAFTDSQHGDWCVGNAPSRWDISFGTRLLAEVRRFFSRRTAAQPSMSRPTAPARALPLIEPLNHPAMFKANAERPLRRAA